MLHTGGRSAKREREREREREMKKMRKRKEGKNKRVLCSSALCPTMAIAPATSHFKTPAHASSDRSRNWRNEEAPGKTKEETSISSLSALLSLCHDSNAIPTDSLGIVLLTHSQETLRHQPSHCASRRRRRPGSSAREREREREAATTCLRL